MTAHAHIPPELVAQSAEALDRHAKSFRWGAFFLPAERRVEASLLYAFCRLADDIVDEEHDPAGLQNLRDELEGRRAPRPLVEAFLRVVSPFPESVSAARELLTGVEADLGAVRIADDRALLRYCYRVAGTVGLLMCPVLGVTDRAGIAHAIDLGIGMQLTNICRDVTEDLANDRVYLPATRLERAGAPAGATSGPAFERAARLVASDLLALAERYYRSGAQGYRYIPARSRFAIRSAARIYREIGRRLSSRGADVFAGRVVVPASGKLAQTALALGETFAGGPRASHDRSLHAHLDGLAGADVG